MGVLGAKALASLETFAEGLLQDTENGSNTRLVAYPRFRISQSHLSDLPSQVPQGR
jgi:hypothetical protein